MGDANLIPDRRRKHFPRNGGPRPTGPDRTRGRHGIAAARAALAAALPGPPMDPTITRRLTPEQIVRARQGLAAARNALQSSDDEPTAESTAA